MWKNTINKTIGIVGGMGPEAGYALGNSILKNTKVSHDQQHMPVVLVSFPGNIGDRTAFLEGGIPENPGYEIAKLVLKLETMGAEIVGLACNTAHAKSIFYVILKELIDKNSRVKLLNMPWETCKLIKNKYPGIRRIGLMASNGTYKSGTYRNKFLDKEYEFILPEFDFQNDVIHRLVYDPQFGIKANPGRLTSEAKILLHEALDFFTQNQTELIILGCTEIPLVLPNKQVQGMTLINTTDALAASLVREARNLERVIH